jgi:putative acetyltransferase
VSDIHIRLADFDDPRVIELLTAHTASARAQTAQGSAHALDLRQLRAADIAVWTIWRAPELLGVGALKRISAVEAEIKSMHTVEAARRQGIGHAMLDHLLAVARSERLSQVSLETGSWSYFAPARALYAAYGFVQCGPFGPYHADPNSVFMTLRL